MDKENTNARDNQNPGGNSPEADEAADETTVTVERRKEDRRKKERRETLCEKADDSARLREEIDSLKDQMLRRQADFENYKKRAIKQNAEVRNQAIKDFAMDIIMIYDDLLRAIEASKSVSEGISPEQSHSSFVEGVSMISRQIEEALSRYGIVEVDSLNKEFDPQFNEAVEIESREDIKVDTVTKVYQKGFRIDDIPVRHARVRVAKAVKPDGGTPAPQAGDKKEGG